MDLLVLYVGLRNVNFCDVARTVFASDSAKDLYWIMYGNE